MATHNFIVVPVTGASDGNPSNWPDRGFSREDPVTYMTRLAARYAKETAQSHAGSKYVLDKLPDGYALFGKRRLKDVKHVDRYLYGHPSGYSFRSAEEFYEHFKNLMDNGNVSGCTCVGCSGGRKKRARTSLGAATSNSSPAFGQRTSYPSSAPARSRPSGMSQSQSQYPNPSCEYRIDTSRVYKRPLTSTAFSRGTLSQPAPQTLLEGDEVDEENTIDVYRSLVAKLQSHNHLDEAIVEPTSFDWRIDRGHVRQLLEDARSNPRFLPRVGEIVLFVRGLQPQNYVFLEPQSKVFQIWNVEAQSFVGNPIWEAGLVTQAPQESIAMSDLIAEEVKQHSVIYSGYRIEPLSEVGSPEKPWSKHSAYVPLHQIRPFVFYREALRKVDPRNYHVTVTHALEVMGSFALIERWHFKGTWPSATIYNRGLYIGSEMLLVGDLVRLIPMGDTSSTEVTDIMRITSIKTRLLHLDAGENPEFDPVDPTEEGAQTQSRTYDVCIHVSGTAFTRDFSRAWGSDRLPLDPSSSNLPSDIAGYGDWYPMNDPAKRWEVPFHRVLGRCYESEAMRKWFSSKVSDLPAVPRFSAVNQGHLTQPSLDDQDDFGTLSDISKGLKGVLAARKYSTKRDKRIDLDGGKSWFWADNRVEQLDLHEVNGVPVARYTPGKSLRDPEAWKRAVKIRAKGTAFRPKMSKDEIIRHAYSAGQGKGSGMHSSSMVANSAIGMAVAEDDDNEEEDESEDDGLDSIPARAETDPTQEDDDLMMVDLDETPQGGAAGLSIAQSHAGAFHGTSGDSEEGEEDTNELMGRFTSKDVRGTT